jgi:hypothetical protein
VRIGFKEWAVVVDALARGDQILILRKGGISEGSGGFQLEHERFLLFPTLFHQQRDSVIPAAQIRYDAIAPGLSPGKVQLECFAEVVDWKLLENFDAAQQLNGQHVWRDEVIREKFESGKGQSLYVIAVRVFRLAVPVELPMAPHYGGCKSWVELDTTISRDGAQPVLTDREFSTKFERFEQALAPAEV